MRALRSSSVVLAGALCVPGYADEIAASSVKIPAAVAIGGIVECNTGDRALEMVFRTARLADEVADHHRVVPVQQVDRTGPLEDSPAPQQPAATAVGTAEAAGIELISSVPMAAADRLTSIVNEPTVAARGQEVLYTGNWYTAVSLDGGETFGCVDPFKTFPATAAGQKFCCDQVAVYSPAHDVLVWLLQYSRKDKDEKSVENIHRLAVATGNDIPTQRWRYYDLKPSALGGGGEEWFDYPDLAVSNDHLYLTTNVFETTGNGDFTRSVVVRFPMRQLREYAEVDAEYASPEDAGTLRLARGALETMYFATHVRAGAAQYLRIYTWPSASGRLRSDDVLVQRWVLKGAVAPGPDGNDWLRRRDGRITAGWLVGDQLGFAWTAAQGKPFSYPHVRVALVNRTNMTIIGEPHVWNKDFAFAYPAAAPNSAGQAGVSLAYGGNALHPSHAVGVLESVGGTWRWRLASVAAGTDGPRGENGEDEGKWGDYLSVQPHGAEQGVWVASGFTLQGGSTRDRIQPRYVSFRVREGQDINGREDVGERLLTESSRLQAIWEQQRTNTAAIRLAMQRLDQAVQAVRLRDRLAAAIAKVPPDARTANVEDTHRPTRPAEAGAEAPLSPAETERLAAAATAALKQMRQSLAAPSRSIAVERKAVAALSATIEAVR